MDKLPEDVASFIDAMTSYTERMYCGSAHEAWDSIVDKADEALKLCMKYKIRVVVDIEDSEDLLRSRCVYNDWTRGPWESY